MPTQFSHPIRYLSLDLDDTLWPILPVIERAESALMSWFADHAPRVVERYDVAQLRALRDEISERYPHLDHDLGAQRRLCLRLALQNCGYHPAMAQGAWELFYAQRMAVELFDDALDVLNHQHPEIQLIAVSNGNADLKRIGLDHHFSHVFHAHQVAARKPDPAIWHHVISTLGCPAQAILHVGDHPLEDADSARAAGLQVLWLNRQQRPWPLTTPTPPTITDLKVLSQWLSCNAA